MDEPNLPRCLVVEDEVGLSAFLTGLPEDLVSVNASAGRASRLLRAQPWRVISVDLRTVGLDHLLETHSSLMLLDSRMPLTKRFVFSGFRTSEQGMSAIFKGGRESFWVLAKGAQNKVEGVTATATPLGWIALMLHFLGEDCSTPFKGLAHEAQKFLYALAEANPQATLPWARSYWQQAVRYLPQPLAEAAQRYNEAAKPLPSSNDVELSREGLLALNDFREWSLWLAAAQTAVVLRQQGKLKNAMPSDGNEGMRVVQDWLEQQLAPLAALPSQAPGALAWRNHLGMYKRTDGRHQSWESKALSASEALRKLRNDGVHGLKPKQWAESGVRGLGELMDMASFWANCPLLTLVQQKEDGRWRARALWGKEPMDMDLPKELKAPATGLDPERVYQLLWWFPADGPADADEALRLGEPQPVLVDWWPYLRGVPNTQLGVREWVLLTQPERGSGGDRWHAQGLGGTLRKLALTPDERQALTQADA